MLNKFSFWSCKCTKPTWSFGLPRYCRQRPRQAVIAQNISCSALQWVLFEYFDIYDLISTVELAFPIAKL